MTKTNLNVLLLGLLLIVVLSVSVSAEDFIIDKRNKKEKGFEQNGRTQSVDTRLNTPIESKYLNVLVYSSDRTAGVAEWLLQSLDTRCLYGFVGSIPTPGVQFFLKKFGGAG